MSDLFPDLISQHLCAYGCREARYGHICTDATEVADTGNQVVICPTDSHCDDAVMHRTADLGWHTCKGTTPEQWWAQHEDEAARPCPHGPHCDPSEELVNPGDPYATHLVCLVHDQDHPDTDGDPQ